MYQYTIWDNVNESLVGVFPDYESAQMCLLFMSDGIVDGGANLSIETIIDPQEWAMDNNIQMEAVL